MASDEQRVRTMCGWVGVEISRSRVRTPGKVGYGLYRVRGSQHIAGGRAVAAPVPGGPPVHWMAGEWTAYAFTLEEIETEVRVAIGVGVPAAPSDLWLRPADGGSPVGVTTRWTPAYRGRRDLGAGLGADLEELERADLAVGAAARAYDVMSETVRSRQRAANAAFQAEHAPRRAAGKAAYHARRLGMQTSGIVDEPGA